MAGSLQNKIKRPNVILWSNSLFFILFYSLPVWSSVCLCLPLYLFCLSTRMYVSEHLSLVCVRFELWMCLTTSLSQPSSPYAVHIHHCSWWMSVPDSLNISLSLHAFWYAIFQHDDTGKWNDVRQQTWITLERFAFGCEFCFVFLSRPFLAEFIIRQRRKCNSCVIPVIKQTWPWLFLKLRPTTLFICEGSVDVTTGGYVIRVTQNQKDMLSGL